MPPTPIAGWAASPRTANRDAEDARHYGGAVATGSDAATPVTDERLVERLRSGDRAAFAEIVRRYHPRLVRLARSYVRSDAVAEEVAQDTWLAVVRGIDRFEGRAAFRTWLFTVLVNRARSTGGREARSVATDLHDERAVDPSRFGADGAWIDPPEEWAERADDRRVAIQMADRVRTHLDALPDRQRQVVVLRDVDGLSAMEVCAVLGVSEGNQRVLLHRGRARIRDLLAADMEEG